MTIFVSYGSADEPVVSDLRKRLESYGVPLWFAPAEMQNGLFPRQIDDGLAKATSAVLCLSADALKRDWVTYETNILVNKFRETPERIIPVWVGEHPAGTELPLGLRDIQFIDLHQAPLRGKTQLDSAVERLYSVRFIDLPAAIFAMTFSQWETARTGFGGGNGELEKFERLCRRFGMSSSPALFEGWRPRYGTTLDEFRPFHDHPALRQSADDTLVAVNEERTQSGKRPLRFTWWHDQASTTNPTLRDTWRASTAVVFIDTLSMLCPEVRNAIADLPGPQALKAVICIPPYSFHTSSEGDTLWEILQQAEPRRVGDWLRDGMKGKFAASYDPSTGESIRGFLSQVLLGHDEGRPRPENLAAMRNAFGPTTNSLDFLTVSPR